MLHSQTKVDWSSTRSVVSTKHQMQGKQGKVGDAALIQILRVLETLPTSIKDPTKKAAWLSSIQGGKKKVE